MAATVAAGLASSPTTTTLSDSDLEICSRCSRDDVPSSEGPLVKKDNAMSSSALPAAASSQQQYGTGVVQALKNYITGAATSHTAVSALLSPVAEHLRDNQSAMTDASGHLSVSYEKTEIPPRSVKCIYPFHPLPTKSVSYRGYPVDGTPSLRGKNVVVQIVGAGLNAPQEPLPQFPQQELLRRRGDEYTGLEGLSLSPQQVAYNSGKAYLKKDGPVPTSTSFYTSGYNRESAAQVLKPFPESIYETVLSGAAVQVTACKPQL